MDKIGAGKFDGTKTFQDFSCGLDVITDSKDIQITLGSEGDSNTQTYTIPKANWI